MNDFPEMMMPASKPGRALQVFLCHANEDKETVRKLYRRLRQDGFNPWFDEESLWGGQKWEPAIEEAVSAADAVLVCLSKRSATKEGYIQKEIKLALDAADKKPEGTFFLIPVRLEECEVPRRLTSWHWVNLFKSDGYERLLRPLLRPNAGSAEPALSGQSWEQWKPQASGRVLRVFVSYAKQDEEPKNDLDKHLAALRRNPWTVWADGEVGSDNTACEDSRLEAAEVVLALVSKNYLDFCCSVEMNRAIFRHKKEAAVVIPIILGHVDWEGSPFGELPALPKDGAPITSWKDPDEAFANATREIRRVIENRLKRRGAEP